MAMIKRIRGTTRELGKAQGYKGLPIRDEPTNDPVIGLCNAMHSAWELTPRELEDLNNGGTIVLRILGTVHPPVMLYVEPFLEDA